jgi:hypothetical protein
MRVTATNSTIAIALCILVAYCSTTSTTPPAPSPQNLTLNQLPNVTPQPTNYPTLSQFPIQKNPYPDEKTMTDTNLAPMFQGGTCKWGQYDDYGYIAYGDTVPEHQIAFKDDTVLHDGHSSIRLEQQNAYNLYREINFDYTSIGPGDHVVFKVWIKTAAGTGNAGIIGFDAGNSVRILEVQPRSPQEDVWNIVADVPVQGGTAVYVPYGSDWTQLVLDVTIPDTVYTHSDTGASIAPQQISGCFPWFGGVWNGRASYPNIWFADAELYINPTDEEEAPSPVFGYDTVGGSEDTQPTGYMSTGRFKAPSTGTITAVYLYCRTNSASGRVKVFIHSDNSGAPNTLLASSLEETVGTVDGWQRFPLSLSATKDSYYWFGRMSDAVLYTKYDAGESGQWSYQGASLTYPTAPDPFSASGSENLKVSLYATYATSTASVAFNHLMMMRKR